MISALLDDRFLLLETLGRGGMGRVYRAFDRVEERIVALKVPLSPEGPGPRHPLSAEYDAWSRLRHPNIVRAYELARVERGPISAGTPYLVLESFAGLPSDRALSPGRTSHHEIEDLARRMLQALAHVHGRGLVHRDLKPANVLIAGSRRGPRRAKLIDFGLAVETGRAGSPGCLSGSVPFVAPESVVGLPVDGRADLYGLGILLFYLTTGEMPFGSRDPGQVLRWHLEGPPADLKTLRPDHPDGFARFVRRLTCRAPDARPASAEEALFLLEGSRTRMRELRGSGVDRSELATLRLALDAVRLGARRIHPVPARADTRRAVLREARVLSQVHGLLFLHLRPGKERCSSNLARVVLRLLVGRGANAREVVVKHGLHRGLPLGLLGGQPVWDRLRPAGTIVEGDRSALRDTASGIRSFLMLSAERRTTVLVVDAGALRDPLAREVVSGLERDLAGCTQRRRGGLLLLIPRDTETEAAARVPSPTRIPTPLIAGPDDRPRVFAADVRE